MKGHGTESRDHAWDNVGGRFVRRLFLPVRDSKGDKRAAFERALCSLIVLPCLTLLCACDCLLRMSCSSKATEEVGARRQGSDG